MNLNLNSVTQHLVVIVSKMRVIVVLIVYFSIASPSRAKKVRSMAFPMVPVGSSWQGTEQIWVYHSFVNTCVTEYIFNLVFFRQNIYEEFKMMCA